MFPRTIRTVHAALLTGAALLVSLQSLARADTLVLYTSQPASDAQQTVDAFQAAHPDIEVEWVRDGTTQLMTRLRSELEAGVARPDVLLIADSVTMESLKQEGLLQPYLSEAREGFDEAFYDAEGYYYGTKLITTGIVRNTRAEQAPRSWGELIEPDYAGQVTMPSPLYSGAALIHLAALTENPELGWEYYEALAANRAEAQGGNGGVFNDVASGNKPYGIVVDYLPIREAAKGSPVEFVFPEEGVSAVTEPVAILEQANNLEAAQRFVDFLLSEEGQRLVSEQGYLPALQGIEPPPGFPPLEEIEVMPFDVERALQEAEAHQQRFSELFGG